MTLCMQVAALRAVLSALLPLQSLPDYFGGGGCGQQRGSCGSCDALCVGAEVRDPAVLCLL